MIAFDTTYAELPERFYAALDPTPVAAPSLIASNAALAERLGLDAAWLASPEGLSVLSGNSTVAGSQPIAMAYAGQQFGHWSPQLGDGRTLLLGEVVAPDGARFDVQLKGSGPTPFSRNGDGRAWLGPVMREYIMSEAMAALGVHTTRALAAVATGEDVMRESMLPGAVLTRVARSLVRVGTFQFFAIRGDEDGLRTLCDYTIARLYPEAAGAAELLDAMVTKQAELVARWMGLGFIHGVLNTDNVALSGETIDYGPCAFMDEYAARRVFSSIDEAGRYAYGNQPSVTHWNLVQFAQALLPLMANIEEAQEVVDRFPTRYEAAYRKVMGAKIGLAQAQEEDDGLVADLLSIMERDGLDFTNTFQALLQDDVPDAEWGKRWRERLAAEADPQAVMASANPAIIPRTHRIEQTIFAALDGDFTPFHRLNEALAKPFETNADYASPPAETERVRATFCGT